MTKLTKNSKPAAVVAAWVKRLTSGKYKQGTGFLRQRNNGKEFHCCLGVLQDLAVEAGVLSEPKLCKSKYLHGDDIYEYRSKKGKKNQVQTGVLNDIVRDWAGLTDNDGSYFKKNGDVYSLTELNDDGGSGFKKIAKVIQSKPKGLFESEEN